jgi:predicted TIM-barrel fold metal-dependent hydrolase
MRRASLGWSRRRFLTSSAGMAAGLVALQACSDEARRANPSSTTGPGGTFTVPPTAVTEPELATTTTQLPAGSLLIDVQNHVLDYELNPQAPTFGRGFPQASCDAGDPRLCFTPERWIDLVFRQSDTTMAVLSAIPAVGDANPLTMEAMERGRAMAEEVCGDPRVLIQGQAAPDVGPLEAALAAMTDVAESFQLSAWKVYTHSPNGWFFDDSDPDAPQVGEAFLNHVEELGVPVVAVHKGLAGGAKYASPRDIGPAAERHPGLSFLVYHSGFEVGNVEGEYDPDGLGIDRLVKSLDDAGIAPGSNVYAELGSTWRTVMGDPDQAAHVLGKLLLAVGDDNILWGTDSIWYGSPQDQIAAFHAFEITAEFQERFGYPALTAEVKAKILGSNAARVLGIANPVTTACPPDLQAGLRLGDPLANVAPGPVSRRDVFTTFVKEHPWVVP